MCCLTIDGRTRGQSRWKSGSEVLTANYGSRAISDNDANQPCLLFFPKVKYSRAINKHLPDLGYFALYSNKCRTRMFKSFRPILVTTAYTYC